VNRGLDEVLHRLLHRCGLGPETRCAACRFVSECNQHHGADTDRCIDDGTEQPRSCRRGAHLG
jgi:hypothetical protein